MEVSFLTVQNIFDTLPIGYYLGRRIETELSETNPSAYFNPAEDKIVVGAPIILNALKSITNTNIDVEAVVRGLLYHEISHVILTPPEMIKDFHEYADIINIFEDERIETILSKYFLRVNFKKNVILLNRYTAGQQPKDARQAFFFTVRYRTGNPRYVAEVQDIIDRYSNINASSRYDKYQNYCSAIIDLYKKIKRDWESNRANQTQQASNNNQSNSNQQTSNNQQSNNNQSSNSSSNNDSTLSGNTQLDGNDDNTNESSENNMNVGNGAGNDAGDSTCTNDAQTTEDKTAEEKAARDLAKQIEDNINSNKLSADDIKNIVNTAINTIINQYIDENLVMRLTEVIDKKLKTNKKNGSAINSYSGRFDVRAVAKRDDYKWWVQQNRAGHVRQFSKVHFNLIIDKSGSFCYNDTKMNTFIQSLNKINNKDFDYDIITVDTRIYEWTDTKRIFQSGGGTRLPLKIGEVLRKHTKPNANNYNIVLFDGDADPQTEPRKGNAFKFFDTPNTILVTDRENEKYIHKYNKMRKIITYNYCRDFIDAIIELLDRVI